MTAWINTLRRIRGDVTTKTRALVAQALTVTRLYWQPAMVIGGIWLAIIGITMTVQQLAGWWPSATVAGIAAAAFGLWWSRIRIEG